MARLNLPFALALAAVAATLLSACGDAGSAEEYQVRASTTMSAAEPPITKEQFVRQANRICREAWVTVHDNFTEYISWQDPEESKRDRFAKSVRFSLLAGIDFHIFDDIRDLGSPPGDEGTLEAIIGPFQEAVELGQIARWRAFSAAEVPPQFATYNRRARRYGLDDCLVDEAHLRPIEG